VPEEPTTFRAYWKDGLRFDTKDGKFKLKVGGRIQTDFALIDAEDAVADALPGLPRYETGAEFRRARLYVAGTIYDAVEFKAEYDFAGGDPAFKDVYLGLTQVPVVQNIRVGHFKEPFSLEELTSSKYITFLERGLPNALAPSRNTGVGIFGTEMDERMTWALGGFRETNDFGFGFGPESLYDVTARMTGLPWYEDEGTQLLHLGAGYSHKFGNADDFRFRERPEAHLSPVRFVDTGTFRANGIDLVGPEAALVVGPFSMQDEYMHAFTDSPTEGDPQFNGYYVFVTYFLTGEHRHYDTEEGAFGRLKPKHNFTLTGDEPGCGAWELGLRYSNLDLDGKDIDGGELGDVTAAVNWYLNPNVRVMVNYVFADLDSVGDTNIAEARFQIDF